MLLSYREGLTHERQQLLDEAHVRVTREILWQEQQRQSFNSTVPAVLPEPIKQNWNRYAKSHDKTMKRMMTGAEAAAKDADAYEAAEKKLQQITEAARKQEEKDTAKQAKQEAIIDDELLDGILSEHEDIDSDHSEVKEVVFSTVMSPPQATGAMPPPSKPTTPEAEGVRKRSFTLVDRTPEKPRAAPVTPKTPCLAITREASPLASTPQEPAEIPASTAPERLDGRPRREGKNSVYEKAMAIELGLGRGRRRGRGGKA